MKTPEDNLGPQSGGILTTAAELDRAIETELIGACSLAQCHEVRCSAGGSKEAGSAQTVAASIFPPIVLGSLGVKPVVVGSVKNCINTWVYFFLVLLTLVGIFLKWIQPSCF